METVDEVKMGSAKVDGKGNVIRPGFYVAADQRGHLASKLIRVCQVGGDLLFDKMDGQFGVLSECDDGCLKGWMRVDIMPGLGSGINYF